MFTKIKQWTAKWLVAIMACSITVSSAILPVAGWSEEEPEAKAASPLLLAQATVTSVSALGRLEPEHGIIRIAAPSTPTSVSGSVVKKLLVEEGDYVHLGQLLAVTEAAELKEAIVAEAKAALELAERRGDAANSEADARCVEADVASRESARRASLLEQGLAAEEEAEQAQGEADSKRASCASARAAATAAQSSINVARTSLVSQEMALKRTQIYSPMAARVLEILVRPGELISAGGLLELGRVDRMYAIAEVYETDIRHVKIGQKATVSSDALNEVLTGTVEHIRLKVQKQDEIGTDPAARKDARIIEVEILLDNPEPAAALSNLQVEVVIGS